MCRDEGATTPDRTTLDRTWSLELAQTRAVRRALVAAGTLSLVSD